MLHKLAAVKLVRELELKMSGDQAGKFNMDELKKEVIAISCQQGMLYNYIFNLVNQVSFY